MGRITKAIILTAGYGTRRLPITKALEKCMLPIGDRPLIDYIVEDCVLAGVTDIMFVVGEQSDQIRTYYGTNQLMDEYLRRIGKTQQLELVTGIAKKANFHYVVQSSSMPYGTAVPVDLCSFWVGADEQVLVVSGDDFLYRTDGQSDVVGLFRAIEENGATAGMLVREVPLDQVTGGAVALTPDGQHFADMNEHPDPGSNTSNLLNVSRYVFDRPMFDYVHEVLADPPAANGEYQVTEALKKYAASGRPLVVTRADGAYLNGGTTSGWLQANNVVLGDRPEA